MCQVVRLATKLHKFSTVALFLCVYGLGGLTVGCSSGNDKKPAAAFDSPTDSIILTIAAIDSISVLDLTKEKYAVDYTQTAAGAFVKGIDSVYAGDNHFWLYSVNDSMGTEACDRRICRVGDTIRWHFRQIGN